MPKIDMPQGALTMLVLRVLKSEPLHGYAIAQRIHSLSGDVLKVEEGSLYPALEGMLRKGYVKAAWGISDTNRRVRFYRLTPAGHRQLDSKLSEYEQTTNAIQTILRTA
ncbi:MAG: PadR family transcriptional regulator [Acidobacteriia bacterium]|nr:PadR family transcriptional regulator [Terriglobia bacterium]